MSSQASTQHPGFNLMGKVALVTGAAGGLGRAFASALADAGARVAAFDKDAARLRAWIDARPSGGDGHHILAYETDVTSSAGVRASVDAAIRDLGQVDILINNAGIYPVQPFLETSDEFFDEVMAINLKSVFLMCKAIIPHMLGRKYGRIVNLATTGFYRPMPGHAHYAASKGAVIGLTRGIAAEFGDRGIAANCVAPGVIMTDTVKASFPEGREAELVRARAIPRSGTEADVVGTVLFLCSDLSGFVTGQTVVVDGGRIMS